MKTPFQNPVRNPRTSPLHTDSASIFARWGFATLMQGLRSARQTAIAVNDATLWSSTGVVGAINEAVSVDQEWTRIAPFRAIPNEVGLQVFDRTGADAMVAAFNSVAEKVSNLFRGLPVYVGHPDDEEWAKKNPGARAEAVGRIKALQTRNDGLYGRIAFNDEGKRLLSGEAAPYAFHSPRWGMLPIQHEGRKAFRPVLLHSIGLTNNPNIRDNTIGLNEAAQLSLMKTQIIALLAALGRPLTNPSAVTDEQLAAAINEATPVATQLVTSNNEVATLRTQLTTAQNEVTAMKPKLTTAEAEVARLTGELSTAKTNASNERAARADVVLTTAVNTGRITEAQRAEWKTKLTAASGDFAAVEAELTKLKPAVNTQNRAAQFGARKNETNADGDAVTAINTAVQKHIKENGLDPVRDYNAAFQAVQKAQPALFTANS